MRIAIFGGTFDPIHDAHLAVAEEAARAFRLDRVLFVPASRPPHKSGATVAGYEDRYRMVDLALERHPRFEASRLEDGQDRSYSIETIERVRATLAPADELFFLIGADAFAEITTWRRWHDVASQVTFIVAARPGHDYAVPQGARVERLNSLAFEVSSSALRARLARQESPPELPAAVLAYIRERRLYA